MAKKTYMGVDGKAEAIKTMYFGVNGVAKKIKKAYLGVNGVAKEVYSSSSAPRQFSLTYYKIYNHDYPSIYPPSSNSGPVTNDSDGRYLLELNVNGVRVDGLFDKFTVDNKYSPSRTIPVNEGDTIYIYVGNDYSGAYSTISWNGTVIKGASVDASYEFTVSSNLTITFTWETEGIVYINPQSYWTCSITTS